MGSLENGQQNQQENKSPLLERGLAHARPYLERRLAQARPYLDGAVLELNSLHEARHFRLSVPQGVL